MLVPVQYRRILAIPDFDAFDLSSYRMKYATSAPFPAELKAEVLRRWPGGLIEYYGMTEGGGGCALLAHEHPDKLHTVGRPMPGHDLRVIGAGRRLRPAGRPRRGRRPLGVDDDRLSQRPGQDRRGRVVLARRRPLHPHRRHRERSTPTASSR